MGVNLWGLYVMNSLVSEHVVSCMRNPMSSFMIMTDQMGVARVRTPTCLMNKHAVARTSIGKPICSLLPLVSSVALRLRSRNLTLSARAAAEGRGRMSGCTAASAVV